jgi:Mlc titration factor MtfA (ptsG expression regulator)
VTAFYACLLVLRKPGFCYDAVSTVLLYARDFAAHQHLDHGGIVTEGVFALDGQADPSTVVLSWHDARHEATHHGRDNVIVHEFAHQLDFADGVPDGIPPLPKAFHDRWKRILETDFHALQDAYNHGHDPGRYRLLGDYAATDETEFFAVSSERFFMRPHALRRDFPELFRLLNEFYELDPRDWDPH